MTQYVNASPNFSIIAPGGCNARCKFCFWSERAAWTGAPYEQMLDAALDELPAQFTTVSITGGEPTLSPKFRAILGKISKYRNRLERVVLTTNGYRLGVFIDQLQGVVDYVNISRHNVNNAKNQAVFGTASVPSSEELGIMIDKLNRVGIQVTLSKVLQEKEKRANLDRYIRFARKLGASGVFFRKQNGDLLPHPVELEYSEYVSTESSCPACLNVKQTIAGMPVTWKRGLLETDTVGAHEIVMQQTGVLSTDWAGKNVITMTGIRQLFSARHSTGASMGRRLSVVTNSLAAHMRNNGLLSESGGCGAPTRTVYPGECGVHGREYNRSGC